jgi:hypothetical protein
LIPSGIEVIKPMEAQVEDYYFTAPLAGAVTDGGVVEISGFARPLNDNPLIIDLVLERGAVIGSKWVQFAVPLNKNEYVPFHMDIPYKLAMPTNIRISARQTSKNRILGNVSLNSIDITLNPSLSQPLPSIEP